MLRKFCLLTVLFAFASLLLVAGAQAAAKPISCGGLMPFQCPTGTFCQYQPGQCTAMWGHAGTCTKKPVACKILIIAPVCGCNGKTYNNDCLRQSAGVSLRHKGKCTY
jgi:hypothetical protein